MAGFGGGADDLVELPREWLPDGVLDGEENYVAGAAVTTTTNEKNAVMMCHTNNNDRGVSTNLPSTIILSLQPYRSRGRRTVGRGRGVNMTKAAV